MKQLTRREGRLLALALLLACICLLIFVIIKPIINGFNDRSSERLTLLRTLERNQRSIANLPALRKQRESQRAISPKYAIEAATRSEALDLFRESLLKLFQKDAIQIQNIQDISVKKDELRFRADAQMNLLQLTSSLKRLQQAPQLMLIDTLTISADRAFLTGRLSPMEIRLEISLPYSAPTSQ